MIQNRFFKTTQGIPFELVVTTASAAAPVSTTMEAFVNAGTIPAVGLFVDRKTAVPSTAAVGTILPVADRKNSIFLSYGVELNSAGKTIPRNTTLLKANCVTTELFTYKAPTMQVTKMVDAATGTFSAQQVLAFKVIETTPLGVTGAVLPTWNFEKPLTGGLTACLAKIIAEINQAKNGEFFTATAVTDGIQITSLDASRHFKLSGVVLPTKADPSDTGASFTFTTVTKAFAGSGTPDQIKQLISEDSIRRGITHFYPDQNVTAAEFGLPKDPTGTNTTWDILLITENYTEDSPTPVEKHFNKKYVLVCAPAGSTVLTGLQTTLNF